MAAKVKAKAKVKGKFLRGKKFPAPPVSPIAPAAMDAHRLVDSAIKQGRGYLYVDAKGRVRDVRHDADVSALPPRPEERPAEVLARAVAVENSEPRRPPSTALSALHADMTRTRDYLNHCIAVIEHGGA